MSLSPKQKLLQRNKTPLSKYLKNYDLKLDKSLDELYTSFDADKNGWLDKEEAKNFMNHLASAVDKERAKSYQKDKFNELFDEYDEDKNGFLSKSEIAQFIKISFKQNGTSDTDKLRL